MLSILCIIFLLWAAFKITGLIFRICGKVIGGIFGLIGYFLIGFLAVAGFGIAFICIPMIFVIGIVSIVACAAAV